MKASQAAITFNRALFPACYRTELTSRKYTALVRSDGLKQEFITPHCPQQNGMVERVIRPLKEQCIHRQRFDSIRHAARTLGDWISFYNNRRPHQALDMKPPLRHSHQRLNLCRFRWVDTFMPPLPNKASIMRLIGAVLFEQNDEWQTTSRYRASRSGRPAA